MINKLNKLKNLDKIEIIELIEKYSDYVMDYPEEHKDGGHPVCFREWYNNEYQENLYE